MLAAVEALAPLARDHDLVITHGNGPQVGLLALESASDPDLPHPYPFDVLGAQTQGMIGYFLLQALENALPGQVGRQPHLSDAGVIRRSRFPASDQVRRSDLYRSREPSTCPLAGMAGPARWQLLAAGGGVA